MTRRYSADEVGPRNGKTGTTTTETVEFEERIDGQIAAGKVSSLRPDRIQSVHRDDDLLMLCLHAAAGEEIWEIADIIRDYLPVRGPGRPRECGIADAMLFLILPEIVGSLAKVNLLLRNPAVWESMRAAAAQSWPDHSDRRLQPSPPSRFQFARLRDKYLADPVISERIFELVARIAAKQALMMGQFNPEIGSDTNPHRSQFVVADGTWEPAVSNAGPDPILDLRTGELVVRKHDADAYPFHNNTRSLGNMWTMVSAPGPYPGTSTIFGGRFTSGRDEQDSDVAVGIVLELAELLPGLRGLVHDKSATAKHLDRLASRRLLLINGIARAKGGKVSYANLGKKTFRKPKNASFEEVLWAVNGHPAIQVADEHGKHFILLDRHKNQWNPPRTDSGGWALYVEWTIPEHALVPARLHGATVRVRHNSTDDQLAVGKRAGTNLRPSPRTTPPSWTSTPSGSSPSRSTRT